MYIIIGLLTSFYRIGLAVGSFRRHQYSHFEMPAFIYSWPYGP